MPNPQYHHRRTIRLQGYDYSQAGLYFITICCNNRNHLFGEILVGAKYISPQNEPTNMDSDVNKWAKNISPQNDIPIMILNDAGKIANECWLEIPKHFPNVILHEFIVMPNHIHGIIELVGATKETPQNEPTNMDSDVNKWAKNISPLRQSPSQTIGSIVRGFKIGVTKWIRQNTEIHVVWQRDYHEHIIRDEHSCHTISDYILNNPAKWKNDRFYH